MKKEIKTAILSSARKKLKLEFRWTRKLMSALYEGVNMQQKKSEETS